ncbi:MAG: phasin family protein [Coriobacteriales bacterium]
MANNVANNLTETFQNIFLAGVGALSIGGEKAKAVIDDLVERGQVTVDQGRKMNEELKHKAEESVNKVREESIRAYVRSLTPEERVAFAEQMAQIAREMGEDGSDDVVVEAEEIADDDVVINADGTYGGNDVDPVDHLDVETPTEPSAGKADPGDVVINPDGTYGGNDVDPVDHLKSE